MKIVFLTAGAAGMYCGSCMHDNALAKALREAGSDCLLQPLYTPIRTDEPSVASDRIFFGGVNIYLMDKWPLFRWIPRPLKRLLDRPKFLAWATRRASSTDAALLGELTLSMLRGEAGNQAEEVLRLVDWLRKEIRPDAILFTNLLIAGPIPTIRRELPNTKLIAILQGDDAFLDHLPSPYREQAVARMGELGRQCDAIVVNTRFYAQRMGTLLGLPPERTHCLPLSIDTALFADLAERGEWPSDLEGLAAGPVDAPPPHAGKSAGSKTSDPAVRIGYLARIAPEKGLHHLVDAFLDLARRPGCGGVTLDIAGWLGSQHSAYLDGLRARWTAAGLADRVRHVGSPDLAGKLALLSGLDVLSVPTEHEEPKGLSILEAMAAGVPVVLPAKGAFPELVEPSVGGLLVPPNDPLALADALERLVRDAPLRRQLGQAARRWVLQERSVRGQAEQWVRLIDSLKASG